MKESQVLQLLRSKDYFRVWLNPDTFDDTLTYSSRVGIIKFLCRKEVKATANVYKVKPSDTVRGTPFMDSFKDQLGS